MNIKKAKITFDAQEGEVELLDFCCSSLGLELLVFVAQAGGLCYYTIVLSYIL